MTTKHDVWIAPLFGLAICSVIALASRDYILSQNDFRVFYAGGRLAAHRDLYDPMRFIDAGSRLLGLKMDHFDRLPHIAGLFWPVSRLPYLQAFVAWELISLAAIAVSTFLWSRMVGPEAIPIFSFSLPLMLSLLYGRDDTIFLLGITLAVWFARRDKLVQAGLALGVCLNLWHLLIPLVLVSTYRCRRLLLGFSMAGGAAVLLAFWLQGLDWLSRYAGVLRLDLLSSSARAGLYQWTRGNLGLEVLLGVGVMGTLFLAAPRMKEEYLISISVVAGILLGRHSSILYLPSLLPAGLLVLHRTAGWSKLAIISLLAPPIYILAFALPWMMAAVAVCIFVAGIWSGRRTSAAQAPLAS